MSNQYSSRTPEQHVAAFWDKVDKSSHPNDCWTWTAALDKDGYGIGYLHQRVMKAHRISYELSNGVSPGNKMVLHTCDNPSCVNPAHLLLGTALDNNTDRQRKDRSFHPTGEKHPMCRLTDAQVAEIRERYASGAITYKRLAEEYGVSKNHIRRLVKRLRRA